MSPYPLVKKGSTADGAPGTKVDDLVKGIKSIVDVVLKEGNPDAGDNKKTDDGMTGSARGSNASDGAGKLFVNASTGSSGEDKKAAVDAAKAVNAVIGADILQAIIKNDKVTKLAINNASNVSGVDAPKDGTIAREVLHCEQWLKVVSLLMVAILLLQKK